MMDSKGYWHEGSKAIEQFTNQPERSNVRERPVIVLKEGETVTVMKADGSFVRAIFQVASKNKVTLRPIEMNRSQPYLELSESVRLEAENGESIPAQVWDNRRGFIVLRTLPV